MRAWLLTPAKRGRYTLEWDLVREGDAWLSDMGDMVLRQAVTVNWRPETRTGLGFSIKHKMTGRGLTQIDTDQGGWVHPGGWVEESTPLSGRMGTSEAISVLTRVYPRQAIKWMRYPAPGTPIHSGNWPDSSAAWHNV